MRLSKSRSKSLKRTVVVVLHNSNPSSPRGKLQLLQKVRTRPTLPDDSHANLPKANAFIGGSLQASPRHSIRRAEAFFGKVPRYPVNPAQLREALSRGSKTDRSHGSPTHFNSSESRSRNLSPLSHRDSPRDLKLPVAGSLAAVRLELSDFERTEVAAIEKVYFVSPGVRPAGLPNDDSKGNYNLITGDHLMYRYEVVGLLGKGSFGQVVKCIDHKSKEFVAVKVLRAKERLYTQGLVEVRALETLRDSDVSDKRNILRIKAHFVFRNHLCIVTDLLGVSLYDYLKATGFRGFQIPTVKKFVRQIAVALAFTHAHRIIHCDLKPENVLLNKSNAPQARLIDYGSCCFDHEKIYTYIQSRFYRAPEVILGISYTTAIDVWSLGCVAAELYRGRPLFPGEDEVQQILLLSEVLGLPSTHVIEQGTRSYLYFTHAGGLKVTKTRKGEPKLPGSRSLKSILSTEDSEFLDFVQKCVVWDPVQRLTSTEALAHPWLSRG